MPESECGYASLNPCMTVSEIIAEPLKGGGRRQICRNVDPKKSEPAHSRFQKHKYQFILLLRQEYKYPLQYPSYDDSVHHRIQNQFYLHHKYIRCL